MALEPTATISGLKAARQRVVPLSADLMQPFYDSLRIAGVPA